MRFNKFAVMSFGLAALFSVAAHAVDSAKVPEKKRTTLNLYLTAADAYQVAQSEKVLFVDVRTRAEVTFVGMPTVADANIPYMEIDNFYGWDEKKANFKMEPNSGFVNAIEERLAGKGLDKSAKIIVMCRSGDRSSGAANLLAKAGYQNVWSVVDGFEGDVAKDGPEAGKRAVNGWKNAKLPWTYSLAKNKMYLN
jgi:rhodanese-related sulfurtransferase